MGRTLTERWNRVRGDLTMTDMWVHALGKFVLGIGLGVLLAEPLRGAAWPLMLGGLGVSLIPKLRHWGKFWS
jgi:hypothetical protein